MFYSIYTDLGVSIFFATLGNPLLLSPIGSRILINMKEAGEHGVNAGTAYGMSTISAMDFNERPARRSSGVMTTNTGGEGDYSDC